MSVLCLYGIRDPQPMRAQYLDRSNQWERTTLQIPELLPRTREIFCPDSEQPEQEWGECSRSNCLGDHDHDHQLRRVRNRPVNLKKSLSLPTRKALLIEFLLYFILFRFFKNLLRKIIWAINLKKDSRITSLDGGWLTKINTWLSVKYNEYDSYNHIL